MIELWIPITLCAAFFQNLRSALQKHLKGKLSNNAAAYARFLYALPFVTAYLFCLSHFGAKTTPSPNIVFIVYCLAGSLCQIVFTALLLWMFSFRSFAVGTTFSKLEVIAIALLGAIILGDHINTIAWCAIAISAIGVLALSTGQADITIASLIKNIGGRDTIVGLICALFLGGSVVFFRGAALALNHHDTTMAAAYTLFFALCFQTILMGIYIFFSEPGQWRKLLLEWRWAGAVGLTGALASIGWFTAFTLQNASYVRAVGQVELIFTFAASTLVFKEKISVLESLGILLIGIAIVLIVLWG